MERIDEMDGSGHHPHEVEVFVQGSPVRMPHGRQPVAELKQRAKVNATEDLAKEGEHGVVPLDQDGYVEIKAHERFVVRAKGWANVDVFVEGNPVVLHRGDEKIAIIKEKADVAPADMLALEGKEELVKLDQNGSIYIEGGERFVVLPGSGGSS